MRWGRDSRERSVAWIWRVDAGAAMRGAAEQEEGQEAAASRPSSPDLAPFPPNFPETWKPETGYRENPKSD